MKKILALILAILIILCVFASCNSSTLEEGQKPNKEDVENDGDNDNIYNIYADDVKSIDLFTAEYKFATGELVFKNSNEISSIRPGVTCMYTFGIKNADNIALDYIFSPCVEFVGIEKVPLEVKLISPEDQYLIGSNDTWGTVDDFKDLEYVATLSKSEVDSFELQWRWPFEQENESDTDTPLSNVAKDAVGIYVKVDIRSESNNSKSANDDFLSFFE
ncbi:MAG: hypothetical protein E7678_01695 [Ruminococcaceae bacterium]|nr:hypothetical protein [Oscillospiraceae bacterium]